LFAQAPVPAIDIQQRLQEMAARLGYGGVEIYPKQARMGADDRDLGSWINVPYQSAAATKRYAVNTQGDMLSPEQFLAAAEAAKQPADWFAEPLHRLTDVLPDGPPCLQHLMELGFPPGTWNAGMFNLGVYTRKAHPDNWETHLVQLNSIHFPADKWPQSDLDDIKKSVKKKDYAYQCGKHPLVEHCDQNTCRKRKYGIGGSAALPVLSSLSQLLTDPPVWFVDLEGHRLELTTEELLNPLAFQIKCANHRVLVPVTSRGKWVEHLRPYMAKANEIPVADDGSSGADDSSARGLFLELLESFCTRRPAYTQEEMRLGKPYTSDRVTYFRLTDLMDFVSQKGFKGYQRHHAVSMLKNYGATNRQERIGGRVTRIWAVPEFARDETPLPPVPDSVLSSRGF
jgi:hypothetical protein